MLRKEETLESDFFFSLANTILAVEFYITEVGKFALSSSFWKLLTVFPFILPAGKKEEKFSYQAIQQ